MKTQIISTSSIAICVWTVTSVLASSLVVAADYSFLLQAQSKAHNLHPLLPSVTATSSLQSRNMQQQYPDYSCNVQEDTTCPSKNNQICDSKISGVVQDAKCANGDCEDCNSFCSEEFENDCVGCLRHGCSFCPGDSKCYNSPHYTTARGDDDDNSSASLSNNNNPLLSFGSPSCTKPEDFWLPPARSDPDFVTDTTIIDEICQPPDFAFSDPLYSAQTWIFDLINLRPVWTERQLYGQGIRVRINDDGVANDHVDFADRFDVSASCKNDYYPREPVYENDHGTSVAGIIGAAGNNGVCGVGIAPQVTLSACYGLGDPETQTFLSEKVDQMDISSNSIGVDACVLSDVRRYYQTRRLEGLSLQDRQKRNLQNQECPFTYRNSLYSFPCDICDFASSNNAQDWEIVSSNGVDFSRNDSGIDSVSACVKSISDHCYYFYEHDPKGCLEFLDYLLDGGKCIYNTLTRVQRETLTEGIMSGRDGKGIIYVWAAGNAYSAGEDVNMEGFLNTRFTISVGSIGKDGYHASYSTPGSALFVTAPGGDRESLTNFYTTYVSGSRSCHEAGWGSSYACPVVSGVLALVLQVNPDLSWRDVQGILATTSRMVDDDPDDDTRTTNSAGITHSNFYGFGIIDAEAAVAAAESWSLYGPEQLIASESGMINLELKDSGIEVVSSTIRIERPQDDTSHYGMTFVAESVVAYLDLMHLSRGDLEVVLTSPQGTISVLHPGKRPETTQLSGDDQWKLLTVKNWDEIGLGDWTLDIIDKSVGDVSSCADHDWTVGVGNDDISCGYFEFFAYCLDGSVDLVEMESYGEDYLLYLEGTDGLTAADACCTCGGGKSRNGVATDMLIQWRLVVYGRWVDRDEIPSANPPPDATPGSASTPLTLCSSFASIFYAVLTLGLGAVQIL